MTERRSAAASEDPRMSRDRATTYATYAVSCAPYAVRRRSACRCDRRRLACTGDARASGVGPRASRVARREGPGRLGDSYVVRVIVQCTRRGAFMSVDRWIGGLATDSTGGASIRSRPHAFIARM